MRYASLLVLAALASCPGHAELIDIRYQNPGVLPDGATYEFVILQEPSVPDKQAISGCPPRGVCNAAFDLPEGLHELRLRARTGALMSDVSNVRWYRVPEPGLPGLVAGVLTLALLARRR